MKSKPVYEALSLDLSAKRHLFIAEGEGLHCVARALTGDAGSSPARIFYLGSYAWPAFRPNFSACIFDTGEDLHSALGLELASSAMDTAVYVAGRETFLWDIYKLLLAAWVPAMRIRMEPAGSVSRKVYCVHCATMNLDVTDSIHVCAGCGAHLYVRDHFSRPMGAYMGVRVDAEEPGDIPPAQRLYA
jgi:hypothetical protein